MKQLSRSQFLYSFLFSLLLFVGCSRKIRVASSEEPKIEIAILQINDVYEIAGVDGGSQGNLARVAYFLNEVRKKYPHTLAFLAGDFLNPSLINTMKYGGERIRGKQMIEVLNAVGIDLAAFGNHEFDFDYPDLQKRIDSSQFDWIATNIYRIQGENKVPFHKMEGGVQVPIPKTKVYSFSDSEGRAIRLGVFSATINSNPKPYVKYFSPDSCTRIAIEALKQETDLVIGLTHLSLQEDIRLADFNQDLALIMGGHEHDHILEQVGKVPIAKADANARTVYLHVLTVNPVTKEYTLYSDLVAMDPSVEKDPKVDSVIQKWEGILALEIQKTVEDPYEVIYSTQDTLDGRESTLRNKPGKLGKLFTQAMKYAKDPESDLALLNSGSVRIDDQLSGDIRAIDIFRALPFGGSIWEVEMYGSLLEEVLAYSESHKGTGAYLQHSGLAKEEGQWQIDESPLDREKIYRVAISDFLMLGFDIPFLTEENPGVVNVEKPLSEADYRYDVRALVIQYLKDL